MNIVFFGTSEFASSILKNIKEKTDWEICMVVSEPAKEAGRKNKITDSPVSTYSKEKGLNLTTPIRSKEIEEYIKKINPDVALVAAYGQIIPRSIFKIPKFKTVNIHPSLLPKLRGPSPIQTTLLNGLKETGVTLMLIDEKMDSGPILSQEILSISNEDNYYSLEEKTSDIGSDILIRDLPKYIDGKINPVQQDESSATYTHLLKKEDGHVNWNKTPQEIYNQWRAFLKWPGLFTFFKNKNGQNIRLKLIELEPNFDTKFTTKESGSVFSNDKKNLFIACGLGSIKINKLQPENSKEQTSVEFLNGYGYIVGQKLF